MATLHLQKNISNNSSKLNHDLLGSLFSKKNMLFKKNLITVRLKQ